jgi:hypothetical protein
MQMKKKNCRFLKRSISLPAIKNPLKGLHLKFWRGAEKQKSLISSFFEHTEPSLDVKVVIDLNRIDLTFTV